MSDRGFNIDRLKEGITDRLLRFGGRKSRIKRAVLRATSLAEPGPPKPKHIRTLSAFVAEARQMIKEYLKCNSDRSENADQLVFCGSGATACANTLVRMLGLAAPAAQCEAARALPPSERPIVFVGPYEHHSNLLPWRDSAADVVQIDEGPGGGPDLAQLEAALKAASRRPLRVGAFSAASNVTGILTDTDAVTAMLHSHGACHV